MTLAETLIGLGFVDDPTFRDGLMQFAVALDLSANGTYVVHNCYVKGDVSVAVEQNQCPEDLGGLSALVTHPPLAIAVGPKGRVAFSPDDVELAVAVVNDLS